MYTDILINATFYENRIALVENGNLREFHLDRLSERGLIGNIYLGRVVRVLPGIDAAFVATCPHCSHDTYAIKGEREAVVRMHMAIEDASGRESTAGVVPSANGR